MDAPTKPRRRLITQLDVLIEVMAGVVMALTVSMSLYVTERDMPARTVVLAVMGCNLAWGIFDGLLYLVARRAADARRTRVLDRLTGTESLEELERRVRALVDPSMEGIVPFLDMEKLREALARREENGNDDGGGSLGQDLLASLLIAVVEIASAVPVILPLIFLEPPLRGIVSGAVAIALLGATGVQVARWSGQSVWLLGVITPLVGAALVALCLIFGG